MDAILVEEGYPVALLETYLAMIHGSVGSNQYRKLFIDKNEEGLLDVIDDGDLACAYFVSAILTLFKLLSDGVHSYVTNTIVDMEKTGWYQTDTPKKGSVIIWGEKLCTDGLLHRHIGFYIGDERAVSTLLSVRSPAIHHYTYENTRKIEAIYFHERLTVK